MLRIRYGADWRTNSDGLQQELLQMAAARCSGQILIVPEQFSFDSEWRLCEKGGAGVSAFAEVLSFSRLAARVFASVGGAAAKTLDNSGRLIAMAGALEQARSQLKIYGRHIMKPEFLLQLLQLLDECRSYGVESHTLRTLSGELTGTLAQKAEELALILESYESVCAHTDPTDRLELLCERLAESGWAAGHSFYIDGFLDFTAQEMAVLEELAKQADSITINLCCDDLHKGQSVFALTRQTAADLTKLAGRHNIPVEVEKIPPEKQQSPLVQLQNELFRPAPQSFSGENKAVTLHMAASLHEECRGIVAELQRLLLAGCRYRDIAVVYTSEAAYRPELTNLFERCGIPGYFAGTKDILSEPLSRMVLSALEAACYGMEAETVAEYLKSGYAPIDDGQGDALTGYAFVWNLQGKAWEKSFTASPDGFEQEKDGFRQEKAGKERLTIINQARELAVVPLIALKNGLARARNTGEQILALYDFLQRITLREQLQKTVEALTAGGQLQRAQECAQLFNLLMKTLEQIYSVLKDTVRSPEEFLRFLRAALSRQTVGSIPASLDCVHAGTPAAMRQYRPQHLLFLGANEGLLPDARIRSSLLSEAERRQLQRKGLPLAPDADEQLERELLNSYLTLTAAAQSLHISCAADTPSYLFTKLQTLFPGSVKPFATLLPATLSMAAQEAVKLGEARRKELLKTLPELAQPTGELLQRAAYQHGELQSRTVQALYGESIHLSASKIDKYASCPLAFFLTYGLKASEKKPATVDNRLYGTMVHYVLEKTSKQVQQEGGFDSVTLERTQELAAAYMKQYTDEQLNALNDATSRERYLYERNAGEVQDIVKELWEELRSSSFIPEGFELRFGRDGTIPAVTVQGKKASCKITGSVDRVDLYRQGDKAYVRIVDYKTGTKSFNYADIIRGSGLQMLIYLFALKEGGFHGEKLLPAGVLYFSTKLVPLSDDGEKSAEEKRLDRLCRQGLLLNDPAIIQAMDPSESLQYLPCKRDKSGKLSGDLASPEQLELLDDFVSSKLAQFTDEIFSGNIAPRSFTEGQRNGLCDYCEYGKICHFTGGCVPGTPVKSLNNGAFFEELERRKNEDGRL